MNEKNRLFSDDAARLNDECSDYCETIAEFCSGLVMKFKVFVN